MASLTEGELRAAGVRDERHARRLARSSPSVSEAMRLGTSQPAAASAAPYMGMPMDTSQSETLPPTAFGDRGLRQSSVRPPDGI